MIREVEFNEDVSGDWANDVSKEQREVRSFDMETRAIPRKPFPSGSWRRNGSEHQFSSVPSCDYVRRPCTAFPAVPTSASSCRTSMYNRRKRDWGSSVLGHFEYTLPETTYPVDRSNSCCLSSPSLFLYNSSFVDLKVRVVLSFFRCMSFITRSSNVLV